MLGRKMLIKHQEESKKEDVFSLNHRAGSRHSKAVNGMNVKL